MRIAFLCKRQYTGHDVITDRYGRLYEIPFQLARMGHDVRSFCLDYHQPDEGRFTHEAAPGTLNWEACSLGKLKLPRLLAYPPSLLEKLRDFQPDIVIGASDIPQIALATWLARKLRAPCVLDLYDNFEGFGQARIPGFVPALKHAVRRADLLIVVSKQLQALVEQEYAPHAPIIVMGNSLDKTIFYPREQLASRQSLGLPIDAKLIGTAGNLHREKGIGVLYEAWTHIAATRQDVHLVLAGPVENGFPPPQGERTHYLGNLTNARVPELFSALDVGVISVLDSAFGRYCFPQKASEMLACNLAVVAADVGATGDLFANMPEVLFQAGDAQAMATAILRQLDQPKRVQHPVPDWKQLIQTIEPVLRALKK